MKNISNQNKKGIFICLIDIVTDTFCKTSHIYFNFFLKLLKLNNFFPRTQESVHFYYTLLYLVITVSQVNKLENMGSKRTIILK